MEEKASFVWTIIITVLTVVNAMICISGYIFSPANELLFSILCVMFMIVGAVISLNIGLGGKYRIVVPVLTGAVMISSAINMEIGDIYGKVLLAAAIVWVMITLYAGFKNSGTVLALGCLSVLVCFFLICSVVLEALFGDFGLVTDEGLTNSPDGTRVAWVQVYDEGALGGSTTVYVRENTKKFVLIGTLKKRKIRVRSGRFGDNRELEWKNEDVLIIDGNEYMI